MQNVKEELWKDVVGYEGIYQVSSLGRVRSLSRESRMPANGIDAIKIVRGRMLKPYLSNKAGYLKICLVKDGNSKKYYVHRLVAEAFLGGNPQKKYVNHIDKNRVNNCVDNLEWCTARENILHSKTDANSDFDYKSAWIGQYKTDGTFVRAWDSLSDIEAELGFFSSCVSGCCRGVLKTAYGYIWRSMSGEKRCESIDSVCVRKKDWNARALIQVSLDGEIVGRYCSAAEAQRKTGICSVSILDAAHQKEYSPGRFRKTAGGFIWLLDGCDKDDRR